MSQGMKVEFKMSRSFFVLLFPKSIGIVLIPCMLSPSISQASNKIEFI